MVERIDPELADKFLEVEALEKKIAEHEETLKQIAHALVGGEPPPECFQPRGELLVAMCGSLREARDLAHAELDRRKPEGLDGVAEGVDDD